MQIPAINYTITAVVTNEKNMLKIYQLTGRLLLLWDQIETIYRK